MFSTLGVTVIPLSFSASYAAERNGVNLINRQNLFPGRLPLPWPGCASGAFHATNIVGASAIALGAHGRRGAADSR
jgi:hypothetical protein